MGPPPIRSCANSSESWAAASTPSSVTAPDAMEQLLHALQHIPDHATVRGKGAKTSRDAAAMAITEVWHDARTAISLLTKQVNEGNATLFNSLNDSFAAIRERINSLAVADSYSPDGPTPEIAIFVWSGDAMQFSAWLRRFEDVIRMRPTAPTPQHMANLLIGHLDGIAREIIEELSEQDRSDFDVIVAHLKKFFEGSQHRHIARQISSACQKRSGQTSATFTACLLGLVRSDTTEQGPASQKERILEESTFEQEVGKAQMVEQLLVEATAEPLITLASSPRIIEATRSQRTRGYGRHHGSPTQQHISNQSNCFNCGGIGHQARQCPSPRVRDTEQDDEREKMRQWRLRSHHTFVRESADKSLEGIPNNEKYNRIMTKRTNSASLRRFAIIGSTFAHSKDCIDKWHSIS